MKLANFFTVIALAAALLFTSCNKDEPENTDPNQTESTPIVFTATVDSGWEGVRSVGVMIDGTVKEYSVTVSDADNTNATLSSEDPHYWINSDDISVTAWWPYTAGETTLPDVVVQADQSTQEDFVGSDFISVENQAVSYDNPTLTFTKRTARVIVNLTDYTEGLESVKLTSLSTENDNPAEIVPYEYDKENFIYVALVAPQTVAQGTAFITCKFDDGESYDYEMPDPTEWKAGEEYTYTFSLAAAADPGYTYDESTNTYTVYKAKGLLAWNTAAQSDRSLNCTLASDIDLTNQAWTPIGDYSNPYTGTFEGGDHTITGLTINTSSAYAGLIGRLGSGGKVQNLTLENVDITSSSNSVGGVVGMNYAGTITACHVSGSVSGDTYYVGGVVGSIYPSATVIACSASVSVSGTGIYVGGVAGNNYQGTMTACYSSGSVSGSNYVGGVLGLNESGAVTACYHASGSISGTNYVGGVLGYNNSGTMTACYWNNNRSSGIGSGSGEVTKVDGSDVTWSDAVTGMNEALETKQSDWRYELLEGNNLPTLKKNE